MATKQFNTSLTIPQKFQRSICLEIDQTLQEPHFYINVTDEIAKVSGQRCPET
jgi:hypothetical protein